MKIALVHDYLTQRGGAERVFELLCERFPEADIYTSLYDPDHTIDLGDRLVRTTVLQKIPGAAKHFRLMAPFYFPVFRSLDLQAYDLIISSSTSFAKAVRKRPGAGFSGTLKPISGTLVAIKPSTQRSRKCFRSCETLT
jgi:hypothetical protein